MKKKLNEITHKTKTINSFIFLKQSNSANNCVLSSTSDTFSFNEQELTAQTSKYEKISDDPANWVINDSTINFLLLNDIKQNMDYDLLSTKIQFGDKSW